EALASHIFKLYIINHWSSVRAFEPRLPRLVVKMLSTPEHVCVWGISSFNSMEKTLPMTISLWISCMKDKQGIRFS
ncbi:hypothetical protein DKP78_20845, partial [Enterococcus faecium]